MRVCYVITWEISLPANREIFLHRVMQFGQYCPIHQNCWAIVTQGQTAQQIRDYLQPCLGPQDRLFVIRSGTEAAWTRPYGSVNSEWLKQNL